MAEVLLGFLIGVAATYLVMAEHRDSGDADDFQSLLRELKRGKTEVISR